MMEERRSATASGVVQNIILESRKKASICGVRDVDSFDENTIVLVTQLGTLVIKGEGLHIQKLSTDSGEVLIEGSVDSCVYQEVEHGRDSGFLKRLFK